MSKVNQLLAMAMSTTSEDEAIACLRMARKQGGTVQLDNKTEDKDTKYWRDKANHYYNMAVTLNGQLKMARNSADHWEYHYRHTDTLRVKAESANTELSFHVTVLKICVFFLGVSTGFALWL